jgi:hypothetical protein
MEKHENNKELKDIIPSIPKCDICGTTSNLESIIMVTKDDNIERIYHFCITHLLEVYSTIIYDMAENNEYKVNSYFKIIADRLIVDSHSNEKIGNLTLDEDGGIDIEELNPFEVRRINPYESEE